ncbi:50S ribosomal protein L3 N(5)-glutamine methyltransferase [Sessilibacter sp. MAH4]
MNQDNPQIWQEAVTDLETLLDFIRFGATQMSKSDIYFGHGTDNAWDEAVFLVLEVVNLPYDLLPQLYSSKLTTTERQSILELFQRRIAERKPAPYLVGRSWFSGMPFLVNDQVLVPRSPFAELISRRFRPWLQKSPERILDLCTGSGCIGIATAVAFPEAEVLLSDISAEAVDIAWQNIAYHDLEDRVSAIESDLFTALPGEQFDLIVCNPPYVDQEDFESMPQEYHHEPQIALTSGFDGLDFTRRLLKEACNHLTDNGLLFCEVGNSCFALDAAFPEFNFTWIEFENGGHGIFVITAEELKSYFQA